MPMRNTWAVLIAMAGIGLLAFGLGLGFAVAKDTGQSSANVYAQTSGGECELNFTITYHNETIKGSIAFSEDGRVPPETFFVIDGKLTEGAAVIFAAIILEKKLGVGLWSDGAIFPIDLVGLNQRAIADCVWPRWRAAQQRQGLH